MIGKDNEEMKPILHFDAARIAHEEAVGHFSYVTVHDGSRNAAKKGTLLRWTWSMFEGTGYGIEFTDHIARTKVPARSVAQ